MNKNTFIIKNVVSAADKVVGLFISFAEMCGNTISVAIPLQQYKKP